MKNQTIGNAQVIYNEKTDILSVRNVYARSKCNRIENGLHNVIKKYDIQQNPCAFDIEEATYLFKNDVDFLRDFSYMNVKQRWT